MKSKSVMMVPFSVLVLLLIVTVGCFGQSSDTGQQQVEVTRGDIAVTVPADGNLSIIREQELSFRTGGTIAGIMVAEGERVTEGEALARLDTVDLERNIATAGLAVEMVAIDLEIATNSYRRITYPYTYRTYALDIPESMVAINDARREVGDAQEALAAGMDAVNYAEAQRRLKAAQDDLIKAVEKLARGQGPDIFINITSSVAGQEFDLPWVDFWTLRSTQLSMEKAEVALKKAENDLEQAQDELDKTMIIAPFSGTVTEINVEEGDTVSAAVFASTVIFKLVDTDHLELKATVDEIDIDQVTVGQKADLNLDALPDEAFSGVVTFIDPLSLMEGGIVVYEVTIRLDNAAALGLKEGMTAEADIIIEERTDVLLIPERAIYSDESGNSMVAVLVGEEIEEREVSVGISSGLEVEVTGSLNEGEVVVIEK
jgi:multidrug efflux pump subunit AcrA (membrane-fusion protein)